MPISRSRIIRMNVVCIDVITNTSPRIYTFIINLFVSLGGDAYF